MRYAIVDGTRTLAAPGLRGLCPGCKGEVLSKCGEVLAWHWSHLKAECDSWGDGESDWHIGWKDRFPVEMQEVFMGEHRADIKGLEGVLEIQASKISTETIREREEFYGQMAWMLKGEDFIDNFEIEHVGGFVYLFRWKRARPSWEFSERTIFIDFPFGIFKPDFSQGVTRGTGVFVSPSDVYKFVAGDDFVVPESAKDWYMTASELYEKRALVNTISMQMNEIAEAFGRAYGSWFRKFLAIQNIQKVPAWVETINSGSASGSAIWRNTNKYLAEVQQWRVYSAEFLNYAKQWEEEREIRLQKEYEERLEKEKQQAIRDLEEKARRDEAARISAEKLKKELEKQRLEAERRERLEAAAKRAPVLLRQADFFRIEQERGRLCDEILSMRPAPAHGFGSWGTTELIDLKSSLVAAKKRLGDARWSQAVEQGRVK
jgi:competence protein CoiA